MKSLGAEDCEKHVESVELIQIDKFHEKLVFFMVIAFAFLRESSSI
jgi:hypothetical protein